MIRWFGPKEVSQAPSTWLLAVLRHETEPVRRAGSRHLPARATPANGSLYRFPAEIISHAVWLYFRFPLSLRIVDGWLAARGIIVSQETVRQWVLKFGQGFANQIRRRLPAA